MSVHKKYKVVLLGEGRVGKTSILIRYIKGEYNDRQVTTLQASYLDKKVDLGSTSAQLSVWDTAGQERFHALGPIYYRDADGALLVYDITDIESFNKVRKWVRELRKIVGEEIVIVIAGNKVDLEKNRAVQETEAIQYAQSVGATHFCTSAKTNRGLEDVFNDLTRKMMDKRAASGVGGTGRQGSSLLVVEDAPSKQESSPSSTCC
mmetsp:Transcript_22788/g.23012  ORF Transcript_22788/g.23012 Transcript_22788/m.23012 type:complete len:206 (+) Transcript_22788:104-721(+)|eukprot:CAMPEP_0182425668 /NCGR_PEP_ID=MMETSP1167-20130531/12143_1 /TAXON_ID=2988 /ORGANISM="Mallomonas Sp, Strain CCMP3275" /LENGTH=205 /DNA_ID=CAMNT_0024606573 /DNA_START=97 /DNA_END=714 /DNA_ORIENTATION=+